MLKLMLEWVARRSPERFKVGAIYVQGWRWSTGYNKSQEYGEHAEDVAIANFRRKYKIEALGGTMYCTYTPCTCCTDTLEQRWIHSIGVSKYTGKL